MVDLYIRSGLKNRFSIHKKRRTIRERKVEYVCRSSRNPIVSTVLKLSRDQKANKKIHNC